MGTNTTHTIDNYVLMYVNTQRLVRGYYAGYYNRHLYEKLSYSHDSDVQGWVTLLRAIVQSEEAEETGSMLYDDVRYT